VQLLLSDDVKRKKEVQEVKEKKAGGSAGLFLLMQLRKDP